MSIAHHLIYRSGHQKLSIICDFPPQDRNKLDQFIKQLILTIKKQNQDYGISFQNLEILHGNLLYVGKFAGRLNQNYYHFAITDLLELGQSEIRLTYQQRNASTDYYQPEDGWPVLKKDNIGRIIWETFIIEQALENYAEHEFENLASFYLSSVIQKISYNNRAMAKITQNINPELINSITQFEKDYKGTVTAFIIMQFTKSKLHDEIVKVVKSTLQKHSIAGVRADDKEYSDDLFTNVRTYMHGANFGISVFERIIEDDFNPNISLEIGYMMGLNKSVCILKEQTLRNLQADLVGKLYKPFDMQDIAATLPAQLEKWMQDRDFI